MGTPTWWNERRFGIFVHASVATVPAWAPIGESAAWYRSHLGENVGSSAHQHPLVEVLAHHRDRWGHIERFDDFAPLLTFDAFDAEDWARLVIDAGAGYSVLVTKHHDGWAWWDAPNTDRTMLATGPCRDVVAEYAAACERNDIVFGTYYSLLDWGDDRFPGTEYVDDVLHPHIVDLVARYGSHALWGDRHGAHDADHWRTRELLEQVWTIDPEVMVNDQWGTLDDDLLQGRPPPVRTFEHDPPDEIIDTPWELHRGIGASLVHNRAERAEHHMTAVEIVALLTEVVAKGGHLLLSVGPSADGTIPALQREPLAEAGGWIREHRHLIDEATPWRLWGDEQVRFLQFGDRVHAIDIGGRCHFGALDPTICRVDSVELDGAPIRFHHDDDGLQLDIGRMTFERRARGASLPSDIKVYELHVGEPDRPIGLFAPEPRQSIDLAPFLRDVSPGDIVQLGDGVYTGPAVVPPGVILRGLGGTRTTIRGGGATAITLERNARLEHVGVDDGPAPSATEPNATVDVRGPYATVLGCRIDGHVVVRSDDAIVRATSASGVLADGGAQRLTVSRCHFRGNRRDIGVQLVGGSGHEIDSCEFSGHLCAIRASHTIGTIIRGNNISARWWGIHLVGSEGAHVYGNFVDHTMRGVDVDGGAQAVIDGNVVSDGDSGCIVAWGASDCQVSGNRWERCRIGVLAWQAMSLHAHDNEAIDLHEPDAAHAFGP